MVSYLNKTSLPVEFEKIEDIKGDNTNFTKVKIWLMHLGENYNKSYFEKDVVDNALPTLSYIPIVGFIEKNKSGEDDFSNHRYILSKNENGVYRKYLGSAYGVILSSEDNNAHYENRIGDDGIERTYLVCEGILWDMFEDSSNIMNRDVIKAQSMELDEDSFEGYEDDDGVFYFTKFSFRASCILGQDYEPAMANSTIEVQFTMSDFIKSIQSELNDKYSTFTRIVNDSKLKKDIDKKSDKGGNKIMDTNFTQTIMGMFNEIANTVREHEVVPNRWGEATPRFELQDIQENEVIVFDKKDNYNFYGFPFVMNGDKAEIDFACGKKKKVNYVDYTEGDTNTQTEFNFGKYINDIEETAFTKVNEANEKANIAEQDKATAETNYEQLKANYDEIKPKYDAYVQAEEQNQLKELNAQKDAKFAEFENLLTGNADFTALKERKDELSVEDIERECAVLYVKANRTKIIFSKNESGNVIDTIDDADDVNDNFVQTKYGNIPVRR